ncbi:hypothetical protein BGZ76_010646 [Entomortierella beljakovae]|nr:hypothetical protein BGZ76_010646 [Entomortierella beljakovae]
MVAFHALRSILFVAVVLLGSAVQGAPTPDDALASGGGGGGDDCIIPICRPPCKKDVSVCAFVADLVCVAACIDL